MQHDKTICHKIDSCIEMIEQAIQTQELNVSAVAHYLHDIRQDAQRMENGLRWRKSAMKKAGIEQQYQQDITKRKKLSGTNIIAHQDTTVEGKPLYEATITQNSEVIYQNRVHAGALSLVERFDDIDKHGTMTGQSQQFFFGQPLVVLFATQQLEQSFEDKKVDTLLALKQAMKNKTDVDPAIKEMLAELTNK